MPVGIYKRTKKHLRNMSIAIKKAYKINPHIGNWDGGKYIDDKGYVFIWLPTHPHAKNGRYISEYRLKMEKHIGRYLSRKEFVHHINSNRSDNRIENLILFKSNSEHMKSHFPKGCHFGINKKN